MKCAIKERFVVEWKWVLVALIGLTSACGSSTPNAPPPPTCEAGQTTCAGVCIDTASDAHQCGACGHDCLGGSCEKGSCSAVTFFNSPGTAPYGIAIDGTNVYFSTVTEGNVYSCPKLSCALGQALVFATNQTLTRTLASDGKNVYWSSPGPINTPPNIDRCPTSGCGSGPSVFAMGQNPGAIVLTNNRVWWVTWTGSLAVPNTLAWCDADLGCNAPNQFVGNQIGGTGLSIDGTDVFWTEQPPMPSVGPPLGSIHACAIGTTCSQERTIAQNLDLPQSVVSDGKNVYWTNRGDGSAMFCPVTGCTGSPNILWASGDRDLYDGIALDDNYVYFAGGQALLRCPKSGCADAPTVLVRPDGPSHLGRIVVDDVAVYWADTGLGTVSRLAK